MIGLRLIASPEFKDVFWHIIQSKMLFTNYILLIYLYLPQLQRIAHKPIWCTGSDCDVSVFHGTAIQLRHHRLTYKVLPHTSFCSVDFLSSVLQICWHFLWPGL